MTKEHSVCRTPIHMSKVTITRQNQDTRSIVLLEATRGSGDGRDIPLSDSPLLGLLDDLVNDIGKVAAEEALGVNYRTLTACYDSRRVSRRMRRSLEEYMETAVDGGDEPDVEGVGDIAEQVVSLEQRVAELEEERRELREVIETQAEQLAQLERQVGALEEGERQHEGNDAFRVDDGWQQRWRPPQRGHGLPDAGVVTLVAEWRGLRTADGTTGNRVDGAGAAVRRWELETAMLGDFGLTLPPETEPLDASRRVIICGGDGRRWLRRALTVGLWWR